MDIRKMTGITKDSIFRINKAVDYIDTNLHEQLNLKTLADISCFSDFHFHRLFKELTGQTTGFYIKRRRMTKAIFLLINRKSLPISSISELCGYSAVSNFSKTFSQYYGVSPSAIKKQFHPHDIRNFNSLIHNEFADTLLKSKLNCESLSRFHGNFKNIIDNDTYEILRSKTTFSTQKIESLTYMYLRTFGRNNHESIFKNSIRQFSYVNDISKFYPETRAIAVHLDGPDYTPLQYCRHDAGVTIPGDLDDYKHIGKREIAPGLYVTISLELSLQISQYIWCYLVAEWLPTTSYELDARPAFSEFSLIPGIPAYEKTNIKFYLPVCIS